MPSSLQLALRGGRAASNLAYAVPQYRYARMAYKYGPMAARAGARIARFAYRRWKKRRTGYRPAKRRRFSPRTIGENVGTSSSKQSIQTRTASTLNRDTRTLYIRQLTNIDQGDGRNLRERGVINCRGFKICFQMRNNLNQPLYFNVAILSPKNSGEVDESNFFRASGSSRGSDFDNSKIALELHCLPINTDKFTILKHKRYRMNPDPVAQDNFASQTGRSYMTQEWYIKLKRQLRYDSPDASGPTDGPVYFVYWADAWFSVDGSVAVPSAFQIQERHLVYWREPKN